MHILILSKRNTDAQVRMVRHAEALGRYYDLDPALVAALKPASKDLEVRAMLEREAVANLLEAMAAEVGLLVEEMQETVTAETSAPLDVDAIDTVAHGDDLVTGLADLEGLPAPVLEDGEGPA